MKQAALYAGSFDLPHLGHLWMIREASKLFDQVIVGVSINPVKNPLFSIEERIAILQEMTEDIPNVTIESFSDEFTANHALQKDAHYLVRGMRTATDFEYEHLLHQYNQDINPLVQTVILLPPKQFVQISSSAIKQLLGLTGFEQLLSNYLHPAAHYRLLAQTYPIAKHLREFGAKFSDIDLWTKLITAYTAPHRAYHNFEHIVEMLKDFMEIKDLLENSLAVEFAIWYHDYIYD